MPLSPAQRAARQDSHVATGLEDAFSRLDRALERSRVTSTGEIFITTDILEDKTIVPEVIQAYEAVGWNVRHESDREGPVLIFKAR